eukprot:TRINITY_DN12573_c0_g1_i1.p1 TRINITY_DN12573_c0_g1~~TRINITY_DN12573_c0_g1_i1.p1  ORF type:complete len:233 (-),score=35.90 TRINITY_DN12573_c0_g1_i1:79-777(-)
MWHGPYIYNYERGQETLRANMPNTEFSKFLNSRMKLSRLGYKTLDDFLILPVQRVPRYIMLVEAIRKYTAISHPDNEPLRCASQMLKAFAEKVNKMKKGKELLSEFADKLQGYPDKDLKFHTRYLIRGGAMSDEKKRPRYCVLTNDLFIISKSILRKQDDSKKKSFKYISHIPFTKSTKLLVDVGSSTDSYMIGFDTGSTKISFYSHTIKDGQQWQGDIASALKVILHETPC